MVTEGVSFLSFFYLAGLFRAYVVRTQLWARDFDTEPRLYYKLIRRYPASSEDLTGRSSQHLATRKNTENKDKKLSEVFPPLICLHQK